MAFATTRKRTIMNIVLFVAKDALFAGATQMPWVTVALGTRKRVMHALQGKITMKISDFFPITFIMTITASLAEGAGMRILMARQTTAGNRLITNHRKGDIPKANTLPADRLMAFTAFQVFMFALESKAAIRAVIELSFLPALFAMTPRAVLV